MDVRHGNQVAEAEDASLATVVQLLMDAGALGKAQGKKNNNGINHINLGFLWHRADVLSCVVDFL